VTVFQALILGLVQGLTEFLPVSSSGHLVLGQKILKFTKPPVVFDILVHTATLIAIIIFFKKELKKDIGIFLNAIFYGKFKKIPKIFWLILVGTIPAASIGILIEPFLEKIFDSSLLVGLFLILTSLLLFSTKFLKKETKSLNFVSGIDALVIGAFQSFAIFPGISRSGSTVVAGLARKLKREDAFKFSFYLAIPAIIGAQLLQTENILKIKNQNILPYFLGFIAALFTGILSLKILKKAIISEKLFLFGFYCLAIGSLTILLSL
jgi:undecaprenyl-diphosphatase